MTTLVALFTKQGAMKKTSYMGLGEEGMGLNIIEGHGEEQAMMMKPTHRKSETRKESRRKQNKYRGTRNNGLEKHTDTHITHTYIL